MNDDNVKTGFAMFEMLDEDMKEQLMNELRQEMMDEEPVPERDDNDYPWIIFELCDTEYAINSKHVLSIEILGDITPVVDSRGHCPGITWSRGEMIDLMDLRMIFGFGDYVSAKVGTKDDYYMMVVIEVSGLKHGLIVDKIVSVEYLSKFEPGKINEREGSVTSRYVSCVALRDKLDTPVLILRPESFNRV